jgi:nicotinamidase-related amidase
MLRSKDSVLIVIDVQGKLADVMQEPDNLFGNILRLTRSANELEIPVIVTEQLPEKLGPTRAELADALIDAPIISKSSFSCCAEPAFMTALAESGKKQILLCGIESHICVLQTALELLEQKFDVFVAADAVSSRAPENKRLALDRLRQHGAEITVTESALFEWMRDATHPAFRVVRKLLA